MGWGGEQKLSSGGLKNFRVCSLRSVMSLSRGGKAESDRGVSLSQSLCPPLCSSGSEEKKEAPATDSDLPPEYYQKVSIMSFLGLSEEEREGEGERERERERERGREGGRERESVCVCVCVCVCERE